MRSNCLIVFAMSDGILYSIPEYIKEISEDSIAEMEIKYSKMYKDSYEIINIIPFGTIVPFKKAKPSKEGKV